MQVREPARAYPDHIERSARETCSQQHANRNFDRALSPPVIPEADVAYFPYIGQLAVSCVVVAALPRVFLMFCRFGVVFSLHPARFVVPIQRVIVKRNIWHTKFTLSMSYDAVPVESEKAYRFRTEVYQMVLLRDRIAKL